MKDRRSCLEHMTLSNVHAHILLNYRDVVGVNCAWGSREPRHSSKLHKKKQCASGFTRCSCSLHSFNLLPSIFPSFDPHVLSFSLSHRTVQQCSSVPISWIRKTSLAALTRSWCSTEVMRMERELAVSLSLFDSQHSLIQGSVYEDCACLLFLKSCLRRGEENCLGA